MIKGFRRVQLNLECMFNDMLLYLEAATLDITFLLPKLGHESYSKTNPICMFWRHCGNPNYLQKLFNGPKYVPMCLLYPNPEWHLAYVVAILYIYLKIWFLIVIWHFSGICRECKWHSKYTLVMLRSAASFNKGFLSSFNPSIPF